MATKQISLTLPTKRTDGSAFSAADFGGAHIFQAPVDAKGTVGAYVLVGTITAPSTNFTTADLPVGDYSFKASVFDVQVDRAGKPAPAESGLSLPFALGVDPIRLAPPQVPTLS